MGWSDQVPDDLGSEPSGTGSPADPFDVFVRAWRLILVVALLFAFIGALFAERQEPTFAASVVVVVEDARSRLFDRPTTDIERYVASQAAVIRSAPVVAAAS